MLKALITRKKHAWNCGDVCQLDLLWWSCGNIYKQQLIMCTPENNMILYANYYISNFKSEKKEK